MSDCSTSDVLLLADLSGSRTTHHADGTESTVTWGPPRQRGGWTTQEFHQTLADGATLDYQRGFKGHSSQAVQRHARGAATLSDGRAMQWDLASVRTRDALTLSLPDGSSLAVQVPLTDWQPQFAPGAPGTYTSAAGRQLSFTVGSSTGSWWETWDLEAEGEWAGRFTLTGGFAGEGLLRRAGEPVAFLRWPEGGDGTLLPITAAASDAVPSAAARAFQIDHWIANAAELGPMPLY
jgi:hypothetical protein